MKNKRSGFKMKKFSGFGKVKASVKIKNPAIKTPKSEAVAKTLEPPKMATGKIGKKVATKIYNQNNDLKLFKAKNSWLLKKSL